MVIKKHIPNILTLTNLFCGILAIKVGFSEHYYLAGFFVIIGAFFDFFDGFAARLLKVQGELGKQLDSLADMVTFGVAPSPCFFFMWVISAFSLSLQCFRGFHPQISQVCECSLSCASVRKSPPSMMFSSNSPVTQRKKSQHEPDYGRSGHAAFSFSFRWLGDHQAKPSQNQTRSRHFGFHADSADYVRAALYLRLWRRD